MVLSHKKSTANVRQRIKPVKKHELNDLVLRKCADSWEREKTRTTMPDLMIKFQFFIAS